MSALSSKYRLLSITALIIAGAGDADAQSFEQVREKIANGNSNAALWDLENIKRDEPSMARSREWNELAGICSFKIGDYDKADELLKVARDKGSKTANLYLGRMAFLNYDFPLAHKLYGTYATALEKSGREEDPDLTLFDEQLLTAENALSRVEHVTIIDSIAVPVESFIKAYRLSPSAGRLLAPQDMPMAGQGSGAIMAYINEGDDFMMWSEPDKEGNVRLMESSRLTDGSWQQPTAVSEVLDEYDNADYPFMMPDGTTLYFASDGEGSMGGYDIFVASRDAATNEYLQPLNIGMPYNSPYDDFMLAIDEQNGIGWWATDRHLLDDKVTVYVFIPNEMRINYNPEEVDIISAARISDFRSTQNPEESGRYRELLTRLDNIKPAKRKKVDFHIPLPGGKMATNIDDFTNDVQKQKVREYLDVLNEYETAREDLRTLRMKYAEGDKSLKNEIASAERSTENMLHRLSKARSDLYSTLK